MVAILLLLTLPTVVVMWVLAVLRPITSLTAHCRISMVLIMGCSAALHCWARMLLLVRLLVMLSCFLRFLWGAKQEVELMALTITASILSMIFVECVIYGVGRLMIQLSDLIICRIIIRI